MDPMAKLKDIEERARQRRREQQNQIPSIHGQERLDKASAAAQQRQEDLFVADLADPCLRDQQDAMAIPFFSLEKSKRTKPIVYEQDGIKVTVAGLSTTGIATIWDADFLIWVASKLNAAIERGKLPNRRLWVVPYHFLLTTRRIDPKHKGSKPYRDFEKLLDRLQGTTLKTNIKADGERITEAWSWIDTWKAHKDEQGRITGLEIVLSEWFFRRVVKDKAILSIHPDYFLLTGGIERWLYKLARKHCGSNQNGWSFTIHKLYQKYPPGREYKYFRRDLKIIVERDCIPEYHTTWEVTNRVDWLHFSLREGTLTARRLPHAMRKIESDE
jgi:plasmid replication initiation protein